MKWSWVCETHYERIIGSNNHISTVHKANWETFSNLLNVFKMYSWSKNVDPLNELWNTWWHKRALQLNNVLCATYTDTVSVTLSFIRPISSSHIMWVWSVNVIILRVSGRRRWPVQFSNASQGKPYSDLSHSSINTDESLRHGTSHLDRVPPHARYLSCVCEEYSCYRWISLISIKTSSISFCLYNETFIVYVSGSGLVHEGHYHIQVY